MFLSLPHGVRCVSPPQLPEMFSSSSEKLVSHQTHHLHLAPPGPVSWWVGNFCVALPALRIPDRQQRTCSLYSKFPSQLGIWLGIGDRAGRLLRDPHQPLPQQSPTSHVVLWRITWTWGSESFKDHKLLILESQNFEAHKLFFRLFSLSWAYMSILKLNPWALIHFFSGIPASTIPC